MNAVSGEKSLVWTVMNDTFLIYFLFMSNNYDVTQTLMDHETGKLGMDFWLL